MISSHDSVFSIAQCTLAETQFVFPVNSHPFNEKLSHQKYFFHFKVLLDDSTINVATIASSRYVGPLKARVDEWQKQLALFSQTLVSITLQKSFLLSFGFSLKAER